MFSNGYDAATSSRKPVSIHGVEIHLVVLDGLPQHHHLRCFIVDALALQVVVGRGRVGDAHMANDAPRIYEGTCGTNASVAFPTLCWLEKPSRASARAVAYPTEVHLFASGDAAVLLV